MEQETKESESLLLFRVLQTQMKQWCGFAYRISCQIWQCVWRYFAGGCFYMIRRIFSLYKTLFLLHMHTMNCAESRREYERSGFFLDGVGQNWKWFLLSAFKAQHFFSLRMVFYVIFFLRKTIDSSTGHVQSVKIGMSVDGCFNGRRLECFFNGWWPWIWKGNHFKLNSICDEIEDKENKAKPFNSSTHDWTRKGFIV